MPYLRQVGAAWGYDPSGVEVLQSTVTRYDAWGRPVGVESWSGGAMRALAETSYDAAGRPDCVAQRMNPSAFGAWTHACQPTAEGPDGPDRIGRTHYFATGQVSGEEEGLGTADQGWDWRATYTPNGKRETLTDGEGNRTGYGYDGHDRLKTTWYPSSWAGSGTSSGSDYEELTYDVRGLVTFRRLRDGQTIRYLYDARGNLTWKDLPGGVLHETDIGYGLDHFDRVLEARDRNGHFTRLRYDALGRRVSEQSNWIARTHSYDLANRRTRLAYNDGLFIAYEYLVTGEMSVVRENGGFALASYGYDDLGRRTALQRGNGTRTDWAYDGAGELRELRHDLAGTAQDQVYGYTHNAAGQITQRTASNNVYAVAAQPMGDAWESVNGLNQATQSGSESLAYDGRGNLKQAGARAYGYTYENRLASADGNRFAHDPMGRMHWINGHTTLQYDGEALVAELDGDVPYRRRYVHGAGVDEPLVWYEGSGTGDRRWFHADERGSVVAISNGSGGLLGINGYDEYGMPSGGVQHGRFGYTGQTWLPEAGAWYYKARNYAPGIGRFMQTDPIDYDDGPNLYAYVGGDPINMADPDGTEAACITSGHGCVATGGDPRGWRRASFIAASSMFAAPEAITVAAALRSYGIARSALGSLNRIPTAGLTRPMQTAINRVKNILQNNGKRGDFVGAARESRGARTGYDHVTEMRQSLRGLEKSLKTLEGSLRNPKLDDEVRMALERARESTKEAVKSMQRTLD